jgi:NAD(P)-dependent dehydrogenase (short-subunit alcohol dehydrogenase family)
MVKDMTSSETNPTQIALVTGGNRGIGRATALALAAEGAGVILTYRANEAEADAVVAEIEAAGGRAVALQLDVRAVASLGAFAEQVRSVLRETWDRDTFDILINNGGTALHAPIAETTEAQFDEIVEVHFKGVFFLTQALADLIADGGAIVNLGTGLTRFTFAGSGAYAAAKGAVDVLTRYLALELGERGIAVNTLAPGAVATDFSGGMVRDTPELQEQIGGQTAMGRVGQVGDIGPAIAGLVLHTGRWITGQRIEASGGTRV